MISKKIQRVMISIMCILLAVSLGCLIFVVFFMEEGFEQRVSRNISSGVSPEDYHYYLSQEVHENIKAHVESIDSNGILFSHLISTIDLESVPDGWLTTGNNNLRKRVLLLKELANDKENKAEEAGEDDGKKDTPEDGIGDRHFEGPYIGTWSFVYDIGTLVAEEIGIQDAVSKSNDITVYFPIKVLVEINEDGTIHAYADPESVENGVSEFTRTSMNAVYQAVYDMGFNKLEADIYIGVGYAGDWNKFILSEYGDMIWSEVDASNMYLYYDIDDASDKAPARRPASALATDDKIMYVWGKSANKENDNYAKYSITDNKMTLQTLPKEFVEMLPGIEPPLELEKEQ